MSKYNHKKDLCWTALNINKGKVTGIYYECITAAFISIGSTEISEKSYT